MGDGALIGLSLPDARDTAASTSGSSVFFGRRRVLPIHSPTRVALRQMTRSYPNPDGALRAVKQS